MRVGDICTGEVACIQLNASVRQAAEAMQRCHVGTLVVVAGDERVPVGILTDRDIVLAVVATGIDAQAATVASAMTTSVATCRELQDPFDAIEIMRYRGVRRLPVVREDGRLVGMVSADDIFAAVSLRLRGLSEAMLKEQVREMECGPRRAMGGG
ncbi:CBS domain-containing protein [Lysobacter sp. S4-A87]|uniref:CBS domain-containing protein n=1 Tax=Lysobacter sp. S4-A87 TaxID=2925843 RepID=UPI001F52CC18|nr:CBS domain-containing protein [Lysobacter sp. S4-A87]UNK49817.1 CBS domain-containing protein [Lysobacter sp. S4-A87]